MLIKIGWQLLIIMIKINNHDEEFNDNIWRLVRKARKYAYVYYVPTSMFTITSWVSVIITIIFSFMIIMIILSADNYDNHHDNHHVYYVPASMFTITSWVRVIIIIIFSFVIIMIFSCWSSSYMTSSSSPASWS